MFNFLMGAAESVDKNAVEKFIAQLPDKILRFGVKVVLAIVVFTIGIRNPL